MLEIEDLRVERLPEVLDKNIADKKLLKVIILGDTGKWNEKRLCKWEVCDLSCNGDAFLFLQSIVPLHIACIRHISECQHSVEVIELLAAQYEESGYDDDEFHSSASLLYIPFACTSPSELADRNTGKLLFEQAIYIYIFLYMDAKRKA